MKERIHYIDVLNCLAIFFVLVLHSSQLAHFGNDRYSNFLATRLLQTICIPAVYIFFMNSGATLLDYRDRQNTQNFIKKRSKRVLIPFLVWTVIYYLYDTFFNKYGAFPGPIFHFHPSVRDFILSFVNNDINNTFWFFYEIIALYIATPIFSILTHKNKKILLYIVIGYFIFNDGIFYLQGLIHLNLDTRFIAQPLISSSHLGYFILGYLIRINYLPKRVENILIYIGLGSLLLSIIDVLTNGKFNYLNNIGPFLYSVALYLLIKRGTTHISNRSMLNIFMKLSGATLGIYILHPLAYALFDKIVYGVVVANWNLYLPVLNNPVHIYLLPIVTYFILGIVVLALKKIKITKYILP
ncbi:acyltransferase [Limosilactobacillus vaginalis]|nr:acyltransferase [Limosilactobacillus vaginalis]MDM8265278.1 acyltransferase [Limosilactobacillus vaginalis]